jgi:hypothetical protein
MKRPILLPAITLVAFASYGQTPDGSKSLHQFVQTFYNWYVPIANKPSQGPTCCIALKQRPQLFSPELIKALQSDLNAQAKSPGEIVGVDWDPFLNSQDPEQHYQVGSIKHSSSVYLVSVHAVTSGKMSQTADVIAEVSKINGLWIFSNFRSAKGTDLLSSLDNFRKQRQKPSK